MFIFLEGAPQAGLEALAGQIRPAVRSLETPALDVLSNITYLYNASLSLSVCLSAFLSESISVCICVLIFHFLQVCQEL